MVDQVRTLTRPGDLIDLFVSEPAIVISPLRKDMVDRVTRKLPSGRFRRLRQKSRASAAANRIAKAG
jgi:citrate lyase alpha subunit